MLQLNGKGALALSPLPCAAAQSPPLLMRSVSCTVPSVHTYATQVGSASFDKDDDLAVDFVTAASNLRSHCYGIPEQVRGSPTQVARRWR